MFLKKLNGYLLVIVAGLTLLAGILLAVLQWSNSCTITLYGPETTQNTAAVIACSALAGWLAPKIFRLMLKGVRKIRKVSKEYKKL